MAETDKLAEHLFSIMRAVGWDGVLPESYYQCEDKLEWILLYIQELLESGSGSGGGEGLKYKIVEELPASGEYGTIYLVPDDKGTYDEYIWIDTKFEKLGSTDIDLADYAKKEWVVAKGYSTFSGSYNDLTDKPDTIAFDDAPVQGSKNALTSGAIYTALSGKQDTLTAGAGISINNGVISVSYANADEEAF